MQHIEDELPPLLLIRLPLVASDKAHAHRPFDQVADDIKVGRVRFLMLLD
jgi:hypothetical protein